MGIESGRLHFSWISSAEATKFVDIVKDITEQVGRLGPAKRFIKQLSLLDRHADISTRHSELISRHGNDSK
jgi:hypothetical protein